jgi:hypothetical protein
LTPPPANSVQGDAIEAAFASGDHDLVTALFKGHVGRVVRHASVCPVCRQFEVARRLPRVLCADGHELLQEFCEYRVRLVDITAVSRDPYACRLVFADGATSDITMRTTLYPN